MSPPSLGEEPGDQAASNHTPVDLLPLPRAPPPPTGGHLFCLCRQTLSLALSQTKPRSPEAAPHSSMSGAGR